MRNNTTSGRNCSNRWTESVPSSSLEVYAAIGDDPGAFQVEDAMIRATKAVLNVEQQRRNNHNRRYQPKDIEITAEAMFVDNKKLGIFYASKEGIRCFSIRIDLQEYNAYYRYNSSSSSNSGGATYVEVLAQTAEAAIENGKFAKKLAEVGATVLFLEIAPCYDDDDSSSSSSSSDHSYFGVTDAELFGSDREAFTGQTKPIALEPPSPFSVKEFPAEIDAYGSYHSKISLDAYGSYHSKISLDAYGSYHSKISLDAYSYHSNVSLPYPEETVTLAKRKESLKTRTKRVVGFDPLVRVKHTLSRHDMAPCEIFNYWVGEDEVLTTKQRDVVLGQLMADWTKKKDKEYRELSRKMQHMYPQKPHYDQESCFDYSFTIEQDEFDDEGATYHVRLRTD